MGMATAIKTAAAKSWCGCFDTIDSKLLEMNAALDLKPIFGLDGREKGFTMAVPLVKVKKSNKPIPTLLMKHCPFCGKNLKC